MKYILTLEKYQAYSDFKRNWSSPVEMREDVEFCLGRLLPKEEMIKSIDDQSADKGIKFFVELTSGDNIHMYKTSSYRMQPEGWEYYFNKKKMRYQELKDKLEEDFMSKLEQFLKYFKSYDFYAQYIDDGRQWKRANQNNKWIADSYKDLSNNEKKQAKKEIVKHFKSKELKPQVDQVFPN